MSRYEPIPADQLSAEAVAILDAGMASGMYDDGSGGPPAQLRVMAYSTTVLRATAAQAAALWHQGVLDDRIKELIRLRSAQVNGCDACAARIKEPGVDAEEVACLATPGSDAFGPAEQSVLRLVASVAHDHEAVDEKTLEELGQHFSPAEVVEIAYHVCVMLGQHRFHHIFRSYEPGAPLVRFRQDLVDASLGPSVAGSAEGGI